MKKSSSITYKKLSDVEKESLFDKMNNSSSDYIHRMEGEEHESTSAAANSRDKIRIETMDESGDYLSCDSENDADEDYQGSYKRGLNIFLIIMIIIFILLLLFVLLFMLFGVVMCEERIIKNSDKDEEKVKKVIVALKFISYSDSVWKLNVGDLLFKYKTLYAYPGLLFVYLFEEEMIRIMTGFKGEEKREVAREKIQREIKLGKAGGYGDNGRKKDKKGRRL